MFVHASNADTDADTNVYLSKFASKMLQAISNVRVIKELGCFHIIFAQILTAHNFCLTHITASILIYSNALGYFLSIKIEFVMRNLISIFICCCIWKGGLKSATSRKLKKRNKTTYF